MLAQGLALLLVVFGLAAPVHGQDSVDAGGADATQDVIVAVVDRVEPTAGVGGSRRLGYARANGYAGSDRARATAAALAAEHGLVETSAWTIEALGWRCMLYRTPAGSDRAAVIARLAGDPRTALVQPLRTFTAWQSASDRAPRTPRPPQPPPTQTQAAGAAAVTTPAAPFRSTPAEPPFFNDPYFALQNALAALDTMPVQRFAQGDRVRVAVIDSAVDAGHPDLAGRVDAARDFVGAAFGARPPALDGDNVKAAGVGEAHGTAVAGVIAATAHNGTGIVGVAPRARLLAYRACWAGPGGSRCNSFTLAQALAAAIAAGADVINLSLGGPRDPLLEKLATHAMRNGSMVVGAVPPGGDRQGFPVALPGVLAVDVPGASVVDGVLMAPGSDVLTLTPGGGYGFVSGSSLAAAHVSGALALLRGLEPSLDAATAQRLLVGTALPAAAGIDVCRAVQRLKPMPPLHCAADGR